MKRPSGERAQRRIIGQVLMAIAALTFTGPSVAAGNGAMPPHGVSSGAHAAAPKVAPATAPKLVDINSASRRELKTLPGIADAEANRIVAGRPYLSKADLVTTNVIPAGTYLSIKRHIIAKPKGKPNGKA